jgi:hypothetical protein
MYVPIMLHSMVSSPSLFKPCPARRTYQMVWTIGQLMPSPEQSVVIACLNTTVQTLHPTVYLYRSPQNLILQSSLWAEQYFLLQLFCCASPHWTAPFCTPKQEAQMPRTASWHHWPQDHTKAISTDLSFFFFVESISGFLDLESCSCVLDFWLLYQVYWRLTSVASNFYVRRDGFWLRTQGVNASSCLHQLVRSIYLMGFAVSIICYPAVSFLSLHVCIVGISHIYITSSFRRFICD